MAKIKQLSAHEAQKIAAGEVVERPVNIVKELVENAIDAGATRISIYVEDGGKKLIRVVDNGCGMDSIDAQICFDRHATSKITSVNELETVQTFGFRGEALASIASVSQVTLITKQDDCLEGTKVVIDATIDDVKKVYAVASATGTDILIQNLFFNVPARKNFFKTTQTEWRAIQLLFHALSLDYPEIHFSLFSEGKQIENCPVASTVKNRSLQLWEPSVHQHIIELCAEDSSFFSLSGIISDHQYYRYDRNSIYFFVNKRWVKNYHLSSAFIKGYANVLAAGRYPVAAVHITIPTHEVDINIHPRKEEVKFLHPRRIEQALQQAVKKTLEHNLSQQLKRDVTLKPVTQSNYSAEIHDFNFNNFQSPLFLSPAPFTPSFTALSRDFHENEIEHTIETVPTMHTALSGTQSEKATSSVQQSLGEVKNCLVVEETYRLIGQYKETYVLVEKEDGLFLVDQHAAHERILYELFSQRFTEVATVQLMFPQIIILSLHDMSLIMPYLDIFVSNGIIIEQCARDQLVVQAIPVHMKEQSLQEIVHEAIAWITESIVLDEQEVKHAVNNKLQAQMACKAAVKAGDVLTQEKMEQLLYDLGKTANRFSCPHGRPTGWLLSLHEIEKKFKRRL